MTASLLIRSVLLFVAMDASLQAAEKLDLERAVLSITQEELKQSVEFLASDTLQGREAGTAGNQAAAAFLVTELKRRSRVKPAGTDADWFQHFNGGYKNIISVLPGADDSLKNEFILIGAHYDHVGFGNPKNSRGPIGLVHNGADDNASGCAALLELIEAFDEIKLPPRRSLLFVFWDGEEKGLLGSRHFVTDPTRPLNSIRFVLNADMLGRLRVDGLQLQGWRAATGLRQFLSQQNAEQLTLDFSLRYVHDSDHWPFFERGIPSLMLHTGKHEDYHRPSDDAEQVNYVGLRDSARFLFRSAVALANVDEVPSYREKLKSELVSLNQLANLPRPSRTPRVSSARLGVSFDPKLSERGVVQVIRVESGSAGADAGIEVGDEILEFAGQPVKDWADFRTLVVTANSTTQAKVKRGDESRMIALKLRGDPILVGCKTQADDAEPNCAIVTDVIAASPADLAGVRVGQRILQIGGQPLTNPDDAVMSLLNAPSPVSLQIEDDGKISTLVLRRVEPR